MRKREIGHLLLHCRNMDCSRHTGAPPDDFAKDSKGTLGYKTICKECDNRARVARRRSAMAESFDLSAVPSTDGLRLTLSSEVPIRRGEVLTSNDLLDLYQIDKDTWDVQAQSLKVLPTAKVDVDKTTISILLRRKKSRSVLTPVVVGATLPPPPKPQTPNGLQVTACIPDIHIGYARSRDGKLVPYHDRGALDIILQLVREMQPDHIIFFGDVLDLPETTTKFLVDSNAFRTLNPALREAHWWLQLFRRGCPTATMDLIEGNHEKRLNNLLLSRVPQLHDIRQAGSDEAVLTIPNLLSLSQIGCNYHGPYPDGAIWINHNLRAHHGATYRQESGESVKQVLASARSSEVFGHIHRLERASRTVYRHAGSVTYTAVSAGSVVDLNGPIPHAGTKMNWQTGFLKIEHEPGNGGFQIHSIEIYNNECIYGGKRYVGKPNIKRIEAEAKLSQP